VPKGKGLKNSAEVDISNDKQVAIKSKQKNQLNDEEKKSTSKYFVIHFNIWYFIILM